MDLAYPNLTDAEYTYIIITIIGFIVLMPTGMFLGFKGLVTATAIMTLFCFLAMRAMASFAGTGNSSLPLDTDDISFLIFVAFYFSFLSLGIYYLSDFIKGKNTYGYYLIIWAGLVLIPVFNYFYKIYNLNYKFRYYIQTTIYVTSPKELPNIYNKLTIVSPSKKMNIPLMELNDEHKIKEYDKKYRYFVASKKDILIPKDFEKIILSWYSLTEGKHYNDEFKILIDKFEFTPGYYIPNTFGSKQGDLAYSKIDNIVLHLHSNGQASAFKMKYGDRQILFTYWNVDYTEMEPEVLNKIISNYNSKSTHPVPKPDEAKRIFSYASIFKWSLKLEQFLEHSKLRTSIYELSFKKYSREATTMEKGHNLSLPEAIGIRHTQNKFPSFLIEFDREEIIDVVKSFDTKEEITILVTANNDQISVKNIRLSYLDKSVELKKWSISNN